MARKGASSGELRLTRDSVLASAGRQVSWESAARELDVPAGLAFLVGTGIPADGSGVPELAGRVGDAPALSSPQTLVNPRAHNPLRNEGIEGWIARRAARELKG